jgi:hypothetical protein
LISRKKGREGEREGRGRKSENGAKGRPVRRIELQSKMVEPLYLLGLRDGLHQNVAGWRWSLCDPIDIDGHPHPKCAVRDPKWRMLKLEGA